MQITFIHCHVHVKMALIPVYGKATTTIRRSGNAEIRMTDRAGTKLLDNTVNSSFYDKYF